MAADTMTDTMKIVRAPGFSEICLAFQLYGERRTVDVTFTNEFGNEETVTMVVQSLFHEDGSGKSVIVTGSATHSTTRRRHIGGGRVEFYTHDVSRRGWIKVPA
jgi:hypothetical protein